jgi:hypothetical protein
MCPESRPAGTWRIARENKHPRQHLKNFTYALQTDAYAGFHHLYDNHIYEAAC